MLFLLCGDWSHCWNAAYWIWMLKLRIFTEICNWEFSSYNIILTGFAMQLNEQYEKMTRAKKTPKQAHTHRDEERAADLWRRNSIWKQISILFNRFGIQWRWEYNALRTPCIPYKKQTFNAKASGWQFMELIFSHFEQDNGPEWPHLNNHFNKMSQLFRCLGFLLVFFYFENGQFVWICDTTTMSFKCHFFLSFFSLSLFLAYREKILKL